MSSLKCDFCNDEHLYRIHSVGKGKWACDKCYKAPPSRANIAGLKSVVTLLKGQHGETKISQSEINEIKRNVCIPIGNGRWKGGRRMENGKIAERPLNS